MLGSNNLKPSDQVTILDRLAPVSQGVSTVTGAWVKASDFYAFLAIIHAGVLGAAATLDAKIQQATDSGGTGVKDVPGAAIVQMVKATDDGKSAMINLQAEKLDINGGFDYIRLSMTVAAAASLVSAELYGINPRYGVAAHAAFEFTPVNVN